MWKYPDIDPVIISIGPLAIHWYAISYMVGIGVVWWLLSRRVKARSLPWTGDDIADLAFYGMLGVILGGRIGYMLFYNFDVLLDKPLTIFRIWEGGMSFHGGMLGVLVAMFVYGIQKRRHFFDITDFIAPAIPIALGCGRLGNFANAELPGRVTDLPWGVVYPGDVVARHPSSLYQFILEGPVLFTILWTFSMKPRPRMAVSGAFLVGYGCLRFISENFRAPDPQLGFIAFGWLTMGQLLCVPMVLFGIAFLLYSYRTQTPGTIGKNL
ncbi:MAG: prolipoprotein diacylglyceryl transferase [Pseudomonadales bacterium]|nr:prolipoprotein diacylglyceryl transferase [Pseudomonadales bacterium]